MTDLKKEKENPICKLCEDDASPLNKEGYCIYCQKGLELGRASAIADVLKLLQDYPFEDFNYCGCLSCKKLRFIKETLEALK